MWGTIVFWVSSSGTLALADWAFVVLGDSREDFRRHRVFGEILQGIHQTAYRIKGQGWKPEFFLH
jgi:hypothetical protein